MHFWISLFYEYKGTHVLSLYAFSNGTLSPKSATKGPHWISLCVSLSLSGVFQHVDGNSVLPQLFAQQVLRGMALQRLVSPLQKTALKARRTTLPRHAVLRKTVKRSESFFLRIRHDNSKMSLNGPRARVRSPQKLESEKRPLTLEGFFQIFGFR